MRLAYFFIFFLLSCNERSADTVCDSAILKNSKPEDTSASQKSFSLNKSDIKYTVSETLGTTGEFLREVCFGNYCAYQIGRGKIDTILGYRFECNKPVPYLPWYFESDSETIVLQRSCGSGCGTVQLYFIEKERIIDRGEFENPIAIDLRNKLIALQGSSDCTVIVYDYANGDSTQYRIPFSTGGYVTAGYNGEFDGNMLIIRDEPKKHNTKISLKLPPTIRNP
jgi:hypothetical protein